MKNNELQIELEKEREKIEKVLELIEEELDYDYISDKTYAYGNIKRRLINILSDYEDEDEDEYEDEE